MPSKRPKRLCNVCYIRPPVVPDRNSGSPIKRVCAECHANRLRNDLRRIMAAEARRSLETKEEGTE